MEQRADGDSRGRGGLKPPGATKSCQSGVLSLGLCSLDLSSVDSVLPQATSATSPSSHQPLQPLPLQPPQPPAHQPTSHSSHYLSSHLSATFQPPLTDTYHTGNILEDFDLCKRSLPKPFLHVSVDGNWYLLVHHDKNQRHNFSRQNAISALRIVSSLVRCPSRLFLTGAAMDPIADSLESVQLLRSAGRSFC